MHNKNDYVAKLSSAFPYLFSRCSIHDLIELIHLNDLLEEIAFLFRPIRGQEICYTETDRCRLGQNGLYIGVALAKNGLTGAVDRRTDRQADRWTEKTTY